MQGNLGDIYYNSIVLDFSNVPEPIKCSSVGILNVTIALKDSLRV